MADTITIDLDAQSAIDGFNKLVDEMVEAEKAVEDLEQAGQDSVNSVDQLAKRFKIAEGSGGGFANRVNSISIASDRANPAINQMKERVAQLSGQFSTGSEKAASFIPQLLRIGPAGAVAVGAVVGIAGALSVLNNTGLKDGKSNLDRLGESATNLVGKFVPATNVIKNMDGTITVFTNQLTEFIDKQAKAAEGWIAFVKGTQADNGREKFFKQTQEGFDKLREVEKKLALQAQERGEAERIAGLKTEEEVRKQLQFLQQEQAQKALNRSLDEKAIEDYTKKREALESQLTAVIKQANDQRAANIKAFNDAKIADENRVAKFYKEARDRETKAFGEAIELQKRIAKDFRDFQRGLAADTRSNLISDVEARVRAEAEEKKALAERLEGKAKEAELRKIDNETEGILHQARLKRIKEELNEALATTKVQQLQEDLVKHQSEEADVRFNKALLQRHKEREQQLKQQLVSAQADAQKLVYDATRKYADEEAAYRRFNLVQQINDRKEAAAKQIELEKQKKEALKAALNDGGKGADGQPDANAQAAAFDAKAILQGQSAKNVLKQLQDRARKEAEAKFKKDNAGREREAMFDSDLRDSFNQDAQQAGNKAAQQTAKNFAADQRERALRARMTAEQLAKRDASGDNNFKIDPRQLAQAQVDAANATAKDLVSQGKLDANVAQALANQLRIAGNQQVKVDEIAEQVRQLQEAQAALLGQQQRQGNRSGLGGQRQ